MTGGLLMPFDNYDPVTAKGAYWPQSSSSRLPARAWQIGMTIHDLKAIGLLDFFEGAGDDPTGLVGYSAGKLWLRTASGVTVTPPEVRAWNQSGATNLLASWPIATRTAFMALDVSALGIRFNVRSYGAVGDGTADDTAAIQAACNAAAAAGGVVLFPVPGKYKVTSTVTVTSNYAVSIVSDMGPDNTSAPQGYISIGAAIAGPVFSIAARGGTIQGLWFRDPTSVLGVSQGTRAVHSALKLSPFGMGKVIDCAFDGLLGSAIEIDSMIRGHIVRPHIRDCGTPARPALWLNPQSALGAGQIAIHAPHIETCYGVYLRVGANAIDAKVISGQFEADSAIAATCQYMIENLGDRTAVVGCGFNRNTETAFRGQGNRALVTGCHFNDASGVQSSPRITLAGNHNQVTGCRIAGTAASTGKAIEDTGGNNIFDGTFVYFGGNVVLGANSVWNGGGVFDAKTTEAYCIEGASGATVSGAYVSGADVAGGVRAVAGMVVAGCNIVGNAGIGIRCESSTAVVHGNRCASNTGGDLSFTHYPHGYSANANHAGDGGYPLQATMTWNPGSIANGASASENVTVAGAALGDVAFAQFPVIVSGSGVNGMQISASVYAADTVKVTIGNLSGGTVDLDSGTLVVKVLKQ